MILSTILSSFILICSPTNDNHQQSIKYKNFKNLKPIVYNDSTGIGKKIIYTKIPTKLIKLNKKSIQSSRNKKKDIFWPKKHMYQIQAYI